MSEEEKKAIEYFKALDKLTFEPYLSILLKLVTKQQKEIKDQKDLYEKLFNAYNKRVKEIEELEEDTENEKKCIEDMGE